ncbi:MAG TPA: hypothetical protein VFN97_18915 [Actinospica sp.]|nr:hypothetical protein [Actinospica sp.]
MAADDLPGPVVTFLNVIGIDWPYIDEDQVRQFATLVREFGQAVDQTHQDATQAIQGFSQAYQGSSTQVMSSGWSNLSAAHVTEIVEGTRILAEALDIGADFIVAQKIEAIAELIVMAATFVADQAAAVATLGLAEAAVPAIIAAGKALVETLKQQIIQMIAGQIIEAAAKPLFAKVEQMVSGLDWSNAGGGGGQSSAVQIDFAEARQHVETLRAHAETMAGHAQTLSSGLSGLSF